MCEWNSEQQRIIQAAEDGHLGSLGLEPRYKCAVCHHVLFEEDVDKTSGPRPRCKLCHAPVLEMCPLDHVHCSHPIESGLEYCPICHEAICPICGSHDVAQISRVTGYMAEVSGWNEGKAQELRDRVRSNIVGSEPVLVTKVHAHTSSVLSPSRVSEELLP